MKLTFNTKKSGAASLGADLIVLPVIGINRKSKKKSGSAWSAFSSDTKSLLEKYDAAAEGEIRASINYLDFSPAQGKTLDIRLSDRRKTIRLFALAPESLESDTEQFDCWRSLGGSARKAAIALKAKSIYVVLPALPKTVHTQVCVAVAEGAELGAYDYDEYKSSSKEKPSKNILAQFTLVGPRVDKTALGPVFKRARTFADATTFARDLVNAPPSDMQPADLVRAARRIAGVKNGRVRCRVYNRQALEKLKANALLAVGRASDAAPYLIHLSYRPSRKTRGQKKIVLVGKGITFDSGGLSLKPGKGMEDMKCDMAGAAAVLGTMKAVSELRGTRALRHELHVLVPTAENMVNGNSVKPGDIVTAMNGKSIEILNTDAEGRLILADALSYSARIKPDIVIDLATLTGACIVAIGPKFTGLFSDDTELRDSLLAAAGAAGERLWPLPLSPVYRKLLDSPVADMKNIGRGGPGASVAALFLKEFVPDGVRWAHLDIAGPAFVTDENEYTPKGGTGHGVRTLLNFLADL